MNASRMRADQSIGANFNLRIIGAIAAKDIVDSIRSKTTIVVIIGAVMMVLMSQTLPLLMKLQGIPRAAFFDAGDSSLVDELKEDDEIVLLQIPSPADLEEFLGESTGPMLGLMIPAGFDEQIEDDQAVELTAYAAHWVNPGEIEKIRSAFEAKLSQAAGSPVSIDVAERPIFPTPDADGQPFMITMVLVMAIIIISALVVPHLFIEEKETHTMDALLLSPATAGQVVIGKALAGLLFGLMAATVILVFNQSMVNNWPLVILAVVSGALFGVALGLLLGAIFENQQNLNLWIGLLFIVLMVPLFLANVASDSWPPVVSTVISWMPTVALAKLIRASFSDNVPLDLILLNLGTVLVAALALFTLVAWRVRHLE